MFRYHDHVGRDLADEPDGVGALSCLARDLDAALLEQVAQARPEQVVIVYEQDAGTRGLIAGLGDLAHRTPFGEPKSSAA